MHRAQARTATAPPKRRVFAENARGAAGGTRRAQRGCDETERVSAAEAFIGNHTFEVGAEAALRLADRSGRSPYDREYVQLADNLNTRLLTYDEPVLEAFPEIAVRPDDVAADA
jgi:hypothetical protein